MPSPKKTHRSKSYIAKEALKRYLEQEEINEHEKQLAFSRWERYQETGEIISHDQVVDWLDTWGSDEEKPCPVK